MRLLHNASRCFNPISLFWVVFIRIFHNIFEKIIFSEKWKSNFSLLSIRLFKLDKYFYNNTYLEYLVN